MIKVLCVTQATIPSTEISIIRPFTHLEQQQQLQWQLVSEKNFLPKMLKKKQAVIFHRNCNPRALKILELVKQKKIPFIYEIDDNYFELPATLPIGRFMRRTKVIKTVKSFLRCAQIVKIGSPELAAMVAKYNPHFIYHPFAVDLSLLSEVNPVENTPFTIGYAGTIHHDRDFQFVIDALLQIAGEFPEIQWDFMGCLPEAAQKLPNHIHTPFIKDYATFLQTLYRRHWKIGLCPLMDSAYNRSKTDNKLREYGACGIAGVYSNIPPYSQTIQSGNTGILAENTPEAWYRAIKTLIEDAGLREQIGFQAHQWVEQERSIPKIAQLWLELLGQLLK